MDTERRQVLEDVLALGADIGTLREQLSEFPWDSDSELVELHRDHLVRLLEQYVDGGLDRQDVEAWAELVEGRDDIGLDPGDEALLKELLFELSNPTIMPELTTERARQLLERLVKR